MTTSLSVDEVMMLRLRGQRLDRHREKPVSVGQLVKQIGGLQAQELPAATLGVRVRSFGLVATAVERARTEERSMVWTWAMRGTLHLLAVDDVGWLLPLLGPVFVGMYRRRREELGLDEETCVKGIRALKELLAGRGPMTRAEIGAQMAGQGILLVGQAAPLLLLRAAMEGLVCRGPDRGAKETYVLLQDWIKLGRAMPRERALAELARRHLEAYAPAGPDDFAAWSGLPISAAREAWKLIADDLIEVSMDGKPAWLLKKQRRWLNEARSFDKPVVRLLPRFDTYLLGYRSRDFAVASQHAKRINAGGGIVHATVVVNGRVVGLWSSRRQGGGLEVVVEPFEEIDAEVRAGIEAEVADLRRFLGVEAALKVRPPTEGH